MQRIVTFNKVGHDPFIDFIKAYAIICVLIGHTFPGLDTIGYGLWAGMQVPLFVLVQAFHTLKKEKSYLSIKKIFFRIFLPFFIVETCVFVILLWIYQSDISSLTRTYLIGGGTGPGSYYPWIYLQIAVVLPFVSRWMSKKSKTFLLIAYLIICEGLEIAFSIVDFPDVVYRLLAVRYIFLFYLAWIWVEEGIVINKKTCILSLLSFLAIIYFEYFSVNDEPLFFHTAWTFHRWPCYYYVAVGGVYLLFVLWKWLSKSLFAEKFIRMLSKCSYEIFLVQMAVCSVFPSLTFVHNKLFQQGAKIILISAISIFGGYLYNRYYKSLVLDRIYNRDVRI